MTCTPATLGGLKQDSLCRKQNLQKLEEFWARTNQGGGGVYKDEQRDDQCENS